MLHYVVIYTYQLSIVNIWISLPRSWHSSLCFRKKITSPMVLTRLIIKSTCLYRRLCAFGVTIRPSLTAVSIYVRELIMKAMKIFSCTAEKTIFVIYFLKAWDYEPWKRVIYIKFFAANKKLLIYNSIWRKEPQTTRMFYFSDAIPCPLKAMKI